MVEREYDIKELLEETPEMIAHTYATLCHEEGIAAARLAQADIDGCTPADEMALAERLYAIKKDREFAGEMLRGKGKKQNV
jgi:hypothetical protein